MCGIVGGVAERNILPILLEGLNRLEYRGYDSAGVALIEHSGKLRCIREVGKVQALINKLKYKNVSGKTGIAHTRWATHGKPSVKNAHPHVAGNRIAVVHNGIIENFSTLKADLISEGVTFTSDTDTEVIAHLFEKYWLKGADPIQVVRKVVTKLVGAYGLVVLNVDEPDRLIAVRSGSPIVIGFGFGENFIASDSLSLLPVTRNFAYLDEGDIVDIRRDIVSLYDASGIAKEYEIEEFRNVQDAASKGQYKHYMQKEIFEQPDVVANTFKDCIANDGSVIIEKFGVEAAELFRKAKHIRIVACGTSYHAGMVARYWLEDIARISCDVEIASELRYRNAVIPHDTLFVTISQSGETADTLAALRQTNQVEGYIGTLGICNVPNSSLVREADLIFMTRAGVEMSVASTKAFTTQLVSLLLMTCCIAQQRGVDTKRIKEITDSLQSAPKIIKRILDLNDKIEKLSHDFVEKKHTLFLGRGIQYPVAMEGALKLKEISYIHAEAYPAGELKHGPLALVDKDMPVVTVAPNDGLLEKLEANLQEVQARGGELYVFVDHAVADHLNVKNAHILNIEQVDEVISPIIFTIPLQLFSYHVAIQKGTDVDQPRNLAKSVTVE